jgi:5,5'-dehydrodivanillate O-demethylase oxygenase subunit
MITQAENELLTRVGPGTPGGEMLRRYWHPVCAAAELTAQHPKQRVRLLGEDLVVFRNADGTYGLVAEQCSHRGASLYYGFLEDGCIRCPYHGWLYDTAGRCMETPFEPQQSMLKYSIKHPAYQVEKLGGLLFAYLGLPETKPLLPRWDILVWKDVFQEVEIRPVLRCSWLQPEENSADTTHLYFLHGHVFKLKGRAPRADGADAGIVVRPEVHVD